MNFSIRTAILIIAQFKSSTQTWRRSLQRAPLSAVEWVKSDIFFFPLFFCVRKSSTIMFQATETRRKIRDWEVYLHYTLWEERSDRFPTPIDYFYYVGGDKSIYHESEWKFSVVLVPVKTRPAKIFNKTDTLNMATHVSRVRGIRIRHLTTLSGTSL